MRVADKWVDYELIDCSDGERLERWGDIILVRPDPQIIWKTPKDNELWKSPHAQYRRSKTGGGAWHNYVGMPGYWKINYGELTFNIKTMGFKHTGIFPEQAVNWDMLADVIRGADRPVSVLNLFGYTGAATAAALKAGASVVHVDASKGMVQWAKENAASSGVGGENVRWIVDDCIKFVRRELRRKSKYDIIIMDPPSYGRGPGGEVWRLEDEVFSFAQSCAELLSDEPLMVLLNSYTTGLSSSVMNYILHYALVPKYGGAVDGDELGLNVSETGLALPCGASSLWTARG